MAAKSLTLLFLQAVAAAPLTVPLVARDGLITCPSYDGVTLMKGGKSFSIECGKDTYQGDMAVPNGLDLPTFEDCIQSCVDRQGCQAVAYMGRGCYLKGSIPRRIGKPSVWGAVLVNRSQSGGNSTVVASPSPAASIAEEPVASPSVVTSVVVVIPTPADAVPSEAAASEAASSEVPVVDESVKIPVKASAAGSSKTAKATAAATAVATTVPSTGGCARPAAPALSTKRGVSYNDISLVAPFGNKISWAYNWGAKPDGTLPNGVKYAPMLWSVANGGTAWNAAATAAIASGSDTLLGFNEPDLGEQANMSIDAAVKGWKDLMEPLKCQARLAAPAVTNGGAPMGLTYLKGFLAACSGCTIDVVPIHWYDSASNVAYFKQYVADAYAAGGNRPIWITEFGASGSDAQISAFFATVLPWLDSLPYVERYAYFMASAGKLVTSSSSLSTIGQAYVSA